MIPYVETVANLRRALIAEDAVRALRFAMLKARALAAVTDG